MSDTITRIHEEIQEYERRCKDYRVKPVLIDGGLRGMIPDIGSAHAKALRKIEELEYDFSFLKDEIKDLKKRIKSGEFKRSYINAESSS